jgi:hypothetical protein
MQIVNIRDYKGSITSAIKAGVIYCGRPSPLGNPFKVDTEEKRKEAIDKYRSWLYTQLRSGNTKVISALEELKEDSVLGCWCKPLDCHCDIIIKAWYWWKTEKNYELGRTQRSS